MTAPRRPAAFRIEPEAEPKQARSPCRAAPARKAARRCRAGRDRCLRRTRHRRRRTAAGDRAAQALAVCQPVFRRGRRAGFAGRRPVDRPAHSRPVRARGMAGLAGGCHGRNRRAGAGGRAGARIPGDCPPGRGRKAAETSARCRGARRSEGRKGRRRRTLGLCRGKTRNGGRQALAGRTARRDHRWRQSGAAGRNRDPRRRSTPGQR